MDTVTTGQDLEDCTSVAADAAKAIASEADATGHMAVTTSVIAKCMEEQGYVCNAQTPAGEWGPGFAKEYACGKPQTVRLYITPTHVAEALRNVGIDVPATLG